VRKRILKTQKRDGISLSRNGLREAEEIHLITIEKEESR